MTTERIYGKINMYASVAQLDRAQDSDSWCRRFESCQVRHLKSRHDSDVIFIVYKFLHEFFEAL